MVPLRKCSLTHLYTQYCKMPPPPKKQVQVKAIWWPQIGSDEVKRSLVAVAEWSHGCVTQFVISVC